MEFKSSNNAEPSKPSAPGTYSPHMRGTIAPTVVEPVDIVNRTIALEQETEGVPHSPQLEKELNSLGVSDEMQKFMQIALRKPHLITVTYLSNTGRFQHHVNVHNRFPKGDIAGVLDHLKVTAEEKWLKKPDMTRGFKDQIARQRKQSQNRGGTKRRRRKGGRR